MSDLDIHPAETIAHPALAEGPVFRRIPSREVPLGGLRAMTVTRTIPERTLPTVGAWCFLDQSGPDAITMRLLPHPHTGLQTVTWPFVGRVRHRDSTGSDIIIYPGQLNLMTSGHGIAHSEFSPEEREEAVHLLQLWVALPSHAAGIAPHFEQHSNLPRIRRGGLDLTVVMGELEGVRSPATVYSPLVGAEMRLVAGSTATIAVDPGHEYAILVIEGTLTVAGEDIDPGPLLYLGTGRESLELTAPDEGVLAFLLGGEPFDEDLVMWWNFVGRTHEDIALARTQWEDRDSRFGVVAGHGDDRIPAPPMPPIRLTARRRRPNLGD